MRLDVIVDLRLIGCRESGELQSHADATIGPRNLSFGIDVGLAARQPEANLHRGTNGERARRPNSETAAADVQRQRRGDGVAESVGHGNPEDDARARSAIGAIGKEMRDERGHDVLVRLLEGEGVGTLFLTVPDMGGRYYSFAFMSLFTDNFAYVWDARTLKVQTVLQGHAAAVRARRHDRRGGHRRGQARFLEALRLHPAEEHAHDHMPDIHHRHGHEE